VRTEREGEPAGRLYKALVETKKATSVGGYFMELHDPGFVIFNAEVRQDQSLDEAKKAFVQTLDAAGGSAPITKEEVERARATLLKNIDLMLNNADRVGLNLSEYIGQGDWRLFFLNRDRIRKATLEDVQKVATRYLKPSNRTIGVFIPPAKPDRAEVPPPVLEAGDELIFPKYKRVVTQYTTDEAGVTVLHLYQDEKEIVFDEPTLIAAIPHHSRVIE